MRKILALLAVILIVGVVAVEAKEWCYYKTIHKKNGYHTYAVKTDSCLLAEKNKPLKTLDQESCPLFVYYRTYVNENWETVTYPILSSNCVMAEQLTLGKDCKTVTETRSIETATGVFDPYVVERQECN